MSLDKAQALAEIGVDYIAVGDLTRRARVLGVRLEIDAP
jgi:nicotinate-nucleotide pyrophosphorylase